MFIIITSIIALYLYNCIIVILLFIFIYLVHYYLYYYPFFIIFKFCALFHDIIKGTKYFFTVALEWTSNVLEIFLGRTAAPRIKNTSIGAAV